jgi:hypothetical protein
MRTGPLQRKWPAVPLSQYRSFLIESFDPSSDRPQLYSDSYSRDGST